MLRPRVIPCLLIHKGGLFKTQIFENPKYVGDPINAVKIFNEKEADELMILDIDATVLGREPDFELIKKLAAECRMPLCYGGGINSASHAARIIDMGVEKVAVSYAAISNPNLLTKISQAIGRQSVVAVLDVRKKRGFLGESFVICTHNAKMEHKNDPVSLALQLQDAGAGEIVINSVDRDGLMIGYDLDLAEKFHRVLSVPLTFLGGAGSLNDIQELVSRIGVIGAAAGSLFVFKGKYRAVLINYPTLLQKKKLWSDALQI